MEVQSQFIEMFNFHELNLNAPSNDFQMECYDDTSSCAKIPASDYLKTGKYAVYDQSQDNLVTGYTNEAKGLCEDFPAVLFGDHSRVIKYINEPFYIGADGVKIIRPKSDNLLPEFLYYDLKYHCIPNTGYNRHFKYIKMIELTKASLEQQKRFLSIAHQADKSKFVGFKSQFIEMFGGEKYPLVRLGQYTNLNWGDTKTTKASYVLSGYQAYSASGPDGLLDHYDYDCEGIVLSAIGADCGKTWFAKGKWSCIKNTIRFWSISNELDNAFLFFATNKKEFWPRRGGAQPFIPQGDARNCTIPLPPMAQQQQFVSIAEQADKSKFELRKSIEAIDRVIKSLINNV